MNGNVRWNGPVAASYPLKAPTAMPAAPLPMNPAPAVETGARRRKISTTIRLDADVLEWLREPGPGYQSRINAILRRELLRTRKP